MRMKHLFVASIAVPMLAAAPAMAADRSAYDGVYTGRPTGPGCEDVNRDFALVLDGGEAHMVYSVASGSQLTGAVTSRGVVHLTGPNQVTLDGQVTADSVIGTLKTPRGAACQVAYVRPAGTVAPATTSVADYDGLYLGRPVSTSSCPEVNRDFTIVVEDGRARMVHQMRSGRQIEGKVTADGEVTMTGSVAFNVTEKFSGQISGSTLTGTSVTDSGQICTYIDNFVRQSANESTQ